MTNQKELAPELVTAITVLTDAATEGVDRRPSFAQVETAAETSQMRRNAVFAVSNRYIFILSPLKIQ